MGELTLILGGARSGKSDYGERLAGRLANEVLFVATAQPFDDEMRTRIAQHRQKRPSHWRTIEAPTKVAQAITNESATIVLVDCMTLLVSNLILQLGDDLDEAGAETAVSVELDTLLAAIEAQDRHWIIVSNEVGLGIVPANELTRIYRDQLGRTNQRLAAAADRVVFMMAGLSMMVKGKEL